MLWNFDNIPLNHIALIDSENNKKISYQELRDKSDYLARKLEDNKKQLIFLYADNSYQSIISYLAILRSGNTCFIIDDTLACEIKAELVDKYQPETIITKTITYHNNYNEFVFEDEIHIYSNCKFNKENSEIHEDLALLLSTSGSTGSPKLVKLTYNNLQSNAESIAKYLNITELERPITSLPISYSYGLSVINSHLLQGATIILTNKSIVLRDFWNVFKNNACTSFSGVPYSYTLLEKIKFQELELPSLTTMTQAGGRLSNAMQNKYYNLALSKSFKFFIMYGQTEATARMSYLPMKKSPEKIGSIGYPIPGGQFRIISNQKDVTDEGLEGEIVYTGDNVMMGYAENRSDLYKEDENKGRLFTGDIGRRDNDGYFYVTGRLNRFIKLHGSRYNLDEFEKTIENKFGITTICYGEDDNLIVGIKSGDVTLLPKIKNKIMKIYKIHSSTINIQLISSIPYNKYGKPVYQDLIRKNNLS